MAHIKFDNVSLQYPIYNTRSQSLRNQLMRIATGGYLSQESNNIITVMALKNLSFELNDGDAVGLVGHNGAGKTTLLRTMSGIFIPTQGNVSLNGSISTIIELGGGLDPELSGYENIIRMGMYLGASRKKMNEVMPDIEEFTELGNFLSMPIRIYSSGMAIRLMFAVSTAISPEILLIDEMFSVGDASFQAKAETRIRKLINSAKIFVFASHNKDLIQKYCNRIFSLEHGIMTEIKKDDFFAS